MRQSVIFDFVFNEVVEVHYCGECVEAVNRRNIKGGNFNGKKEVINCGVEINPYLPDSYRHYSNHLSVRRLACPLFQKRGNRKS